MVVQHSHTSQMIPKWRFPSSHGGTRLHPPSHEWPTNLWHPLHPGTFGGAEVDERLPLTAEQFQLRLEEFKDEILQQRRDFLVDSLGTNFQKLTKKRRTLKRDLKGGDFTDLTIQYGDFMECEWDIWCLTTNGITTSKQIVI